MAPGSAPAAVVAAPRPPAAVTDHCPGIFRGAEFFTAPQLGRKLMTMAKAKQRSQWAERLAVRQFLFNVVFDPVLGEDGSRPVESRPGKKRASRRRGRAGSIGYQVTVPLLPGVITFGRTLAEARAMARDAIRCHLEGLRKAGEPIPDERRAHTEKLRIALSA